MNKTELASERIAKRIRAGEFKPGQRLPSLRAMADEFGVSTMVLRKAVERLKAQGLVESAPKSGLFIPRSLRQYELCGLITSVRMGMMENYFEAFLQAAARHRCIAMTVPDSPVECLTSMLEKAPRRLFIHINNEHFSLREITQLTNQFKPVFCNQFEWNDADPESAVLADWDMIFEQTLRRFLESGRRRIVFVAHNEQIPEFKRRRLVRIGQKLGLAFGSPSFTWCSRLDVRNDPQKLEKLFRPGSEPVAAFATGDSPLFEFMECVRTRFPNHAEIDCIGCYNSFWSNYAGKEFASWQWDWDDFWEMVFSHKEDTIEYYRPRLVKTEFLQKKNATE